MNFATLKGLTIPVPQTVIPETTETSMILLGDDAGLPGSCVVTVDGVEYHCDMFFNEMMEPSLGDSRLYEGDTSNPVDVPFYIVSWLADGWSLGDPSIDEAWVCDVFYPDSNTHTIEIKKMVDASVTQITDASGNVLWAVQNESGEPIVLEVAKQTISTYAGGTTYSDEQCVLLDIYPQTASSRVNVTYGNLTKTLTFSGTNAQQVYFGTFNGVSDAVTTPESGTLTIEGGCIAIGRGTYTTNSKGNTNHCDCITSIKDSGGMTEIQSQAFYGSSNSSTALTSVNLSDKMASIGSYAFASCKALTSATIMGGDIGSYAFRYCDALTALTLGDGVTSIGASAFDGCDALTSVTIPKSVTIGAAAFSSCSSLTSATVMCPTIGEDMFSICKALTNVTIAEGVVSIGDGAFSSCTNLTSVTIPDSVTSIGSTVFYLCDQLTTLTIPKNVTSIGEFILGSINATSLTLIMRPTTPPTFSGTLWETDPTAPTSHYHIIVPQGCGEIYKAAEGWSEYADYITEET